MGGDLAVVTDPYNPAVEILDDLAAAGIEIVADGHNLRFRPAGAMTPELAGRVKSRKPALIRLLADAPADPDPRQARIDAEVARFWRVAVPDADGWTDPAEADVVALIRQTREPKPTQAAAVWPGDRYPRPGGGTETFIERSARYLAEAGGCPPGASRRGGAA